MATIVNNKPAAPLPFRLRYGYFEHEPILDASPDGAGDPDKKPLCKFDNRGVWKDPENKQNAAYIVHAANAYPKLVEALRELTDRIADADQWNPAMRPDHFRLALGTVQGCQQFAAARALLSDLDEVE